MLQVGMQTKTISVAQGTASVSFTFDAIPNATIKAIIPIVFHNSDNYTSITGYIVTGSDVNQRIITIRICGTISAQNIACKAVILYTLNS